MLPVELYYVFTFVFLVALVYWYLKRAYTAAENTLQGMRMYNRNWPAQYIITR